MVIRYNHSHTKVLGMGHLVVGSYSVVAGDNGIPAFLLSSIHELNAKTVPVLNPVGKHEVNVRPKELKSLKQDKR